VGGVNVGGSGPGMEGEWLVVDDFCHFEGFVDLWWNWIGCLHSVVGCDDGVVGVD